MFAKLAAFTAGSVLITSTLFAMGIPAPERIRDVSVSDSVVNETFSLTAVDQSKITLNPKSVEDDSKLVYLPKEKGADYRLCNRYDVDMFVSLTDIVLRIVQTGEVTKADEKLIQKTPRCEPYLPMLRAIAIHYAPPSETAPSALPSKISVSKIGDGYVLEMKLSNGKDVQFRLGKTLDGVRSLRDLSGKKIAAATTGQGLALAFTLESVQDDTPLTTTYQESCAVESEIRRCDHQGRCRTTTISHPGHRDVRVTYGGTSYVIRMSLLSPSGRELLSSKVRDSDSDHDTDRGICYRD